MSSIHAAQTRIIVLGGGYAGITTAQRLSASERSASIILVDAQASFEERIRWHQVAAGQSCQSFSYASALGAMGVEFVQAQVVALSPDTSALQVKRPDGGLTTLSYDYLVYALGSSMDVDTVPGVREHAHSFHSTKAAQRIFRSLSTPQQSNVLVVGGGLTGIETAAELAERLPHLRITLAMSQALCAKNEPGGFHAKAVHYLQEALSTRHIALAQHARISRLTTGLASTDAGQTIPFDHCIWTSGFTPSALAAASGIQVNRSGQITTDASLRSLSHPNIIAIGDAAQARTDLGGDCRMGSATALAMGTAAANTLAALLNGTPPPAFRFCYLFRNISLGRNDGLVQFVDRSDAPRSTVWTGYRAAAWKEYICQSTLSTMGLTPSPKLPSLPPLRMLPQLAQGYRQYA